MTHRPERLKATKLYAPDKSEQPDGNDDNHATTSEPSLKMKLRPPQVADERTQRLINPARKKNIGDENAAVSKPGRGPVTDISKVQEEANKETNQIKSNAGTYSRIPKWFVTRKDMEQRVNKRKENHGNKSKIEKKITPPNEFVKREEMLQKTTRTSQDEIPEKPLNKSFERDGEQKSVMESKVIYHQDLTQKGTRKETHIQHRKTKSTKVTSTYMNHPLPSQTTQKHPLHQEDNGHDQRDANKLDLEAKHLFSKLENKMKSVTGLQEGKHSTESGLPNQTEDKIKQRNVKALRDTKPTVLLVNRKADSNSVASRVNQVDLNKDNKDGPSVPANDIKRLTSASTRNSSSNITPRMTSTAIAKPTRGNAKSDILSGVKLDSVKILVMNANGKGNTDVSPTERRKNAIHNVVLKHLPNIVLFQEYSWAGIRGKAWKNYPFPEQFVYKGHYDASIMYDATCITVQDLPSSDIDTILSGLQRNANNRLKRTFPMDFNPVARMCISRITAPTKPGLDFICISWHGKSNEIGGGRMKELKRIEYFEYWMEFLRNIREKYKLPVLAAGDYNVKICSIETYVQSPFKLCIYEASMRRTLRGIVDFCIVTDDIELSDITWVNLERDTTVFHPNSILDHDPIVGSLKASAFGVTEATLGIGKKKSWPSPISKYK